MRKLLATTVLLLLSCPLAYAQVSPGSPLPVGYVSTSSTNSTLVQPGLTTIKVFAVLNSTATAAYLKIYDTATAPTCGSGTPKWRFPVPANTLPQIAPFAISPNGLVFSNGLGFCLTGAIADNDSTNAVAGVLINFGISRR
jgi:hypothetical protein